MELSHIIVVTEKVCGCESVVEYVAEFAHYDDAVEAMKEYADTFNVGRIYQDEDTIIFEGGFRLHLVSLCRFESASEFMKAKGLSI